ncbi:hypothetical protein BVRB_9g212340 [Beta vulgaris subsp. vulgaris]|nr:hypothetical protein BVRB_9g212340 [Beta vulgaris subsp. vulgaris]
MLSTRRQVTDDILYDNTTAFKRNDWLLFLSNSVETSNHNKISDWSGECHELMSREPGRIPNYLREGVLAICPTSYEVAAATLAFFSYPRQLTTSTPTQSNFEHKRQKNEIEAVIDHLDCEEKEKSCQHQSASRLTKASQQAFFSSRKQKRH